MKRRSMVISVLVVALAACQGSEGPAGPQGPAGLPGPAGPGSNQLVVTGQLDANGDISIALPAAVGTNPSSPPLVACYITDVPSSGAWLAVGDGTNDTTEFCGLIFGNGVWNAAMLQGPPGWYAAFVVAY